MSKISSSLKENTEVILKELPEEFHEIAKQEIAKAEELVKNTSEQELEMIKQEILDHSDIDETMITEIDPNRHQAPALPSEEEQKANMETELKKVQAACAN